ncbi:MAG: hypothetical protein U0231_03110 [Nitrospiraceae bacterium]
MANACYGYFVLPESLPSAKRMPFAWKQVALASLALCGRTELFRLATVSFLGSLAHVVLSDTAVLYLGYRYGWGPSTVELTLAVVRPARWSSKAGLVKHGTVGERRTLLLGLLCGAVGFSIYGAGASELVFAIAGFPSAAFWELAGPSAQALGEASPAPPSKNDFRGAQESPSLEVDQPRGLHGDVRLLSDPDRTCICRGRRCFLSGVMLLVAAVLAWRAQAPVTDQSLTCSPPRRYVMSIARLDEFSGSLMSKEEIDQSTVNAPDVQAHPWRWGVHGRSCAGSRDLC